MAQSKSQISLQTRRERRKSALYLRLRKRKVYKIFSGHTFYEKLKKKF